MLPIRHVSYTHLVIRHSEYKQSAILSTAFSLKFYKKTKLLSILQRIYKPIIRLQDEEDAVSSQYFI